MGSWFFSNSHLCVFVTVCSVCLSHLCNNKEGVAGYMTYLFPTVFRGRESQCFFLLEIGTARQALSFLFRSTVEGSLSLCSILFYPVWRRQTKLLTKHLGEIVVELVSDIQPIKIFFFIVFFSACSMKDGCTYEELFDVAGRVTYIFVHIMFLIYDVVGFCFQRFKFLKIQCLKITHNALSKKKEKVIDKSLHTKTYSKLALYILYLLICVK